VDKKVGVQEERNRILIKLRDYFSQREDVLMSFIFGSWAKDQEGLESDLDIAVYFKPKTGILEWQGDSYFETEKKIWLEIEKIVEREVDFLVLNRAPATVADTALRGIPVVIKDRKSYMDFLLKVTSEAIDFRQWVDGYWKLKERRKHETPVRG
jgi:predicted nucleotidyltransferase